MEPLNMTDEEIMGVVAHRIRKIGGDVKRNELTRALQGIMDGATLASALLALETRGVIKPYRGEVGRQGGRPVTVYRYTGPFDLTEMFPAPAPMRAPVASRQAAVLARLEALADRMEAALQNAG
jgi:hypothetical protein